MFRYIVRIALVLAMVVSAWADNCPECGMRLEPRFQTKFDRGTSWQLFGCLQGHNFWQPSPGAVPAPDYRYRPPAPSSEPLHCPACSLRLTSQGMKTNGQGLLVTVYRCTNGHAYER